MLKKLDWYIVGKFMRTFFFTVLIFTMISVIIDFSEKVEDFIEEPITLKEILIDYYPNFILFIDGLLWPLFTLISVIFFTSRMAYNSEIISIFNAGVSYSRLMVPYLVGAAILTGLNLAGNHYYIPEGSKKRLDITHTYIWRDNDKGKTRDVHMFVAPDTKVYIQNYRKRDSSARDLRIERFRNDELVYVLKASLAQWQGPPDRWRLRDYEIRHFDGMYESLVVGRGLQMDTTIALTPQDFVDYKEQESMMTTWELRDYIALQQRRGVGNTRRYLIELHRRTAEPFTIFILTILGMSIASRKVRGGMGLHLAVGVGLGAIFIFLSRFSIVFATGEALPVLVGIWIPNIVFGLITLFLIWRAQK